MGEDDGADAACVGFATAAFCENCEVAVCRPRLKTNRQNKFAIVANNFSVINLIVISLNSGNNEKWKQLLSNETRDSHVRCKQAHLTNFVHHQRIPAPIFIEANLAIVAPGFPSCVAVKCYSTKQKLSSYRKVD